MPRKKISKPEDSTIPDLNSFVLEELQNNKLVDKEIKDIVKNFLVNDREIHEEIEKVVNKVEKEKMKIFYSKISFGIWSVFLLILGSVMPTVTDFFGSDKNQIENIGAQK